MKAVVGAMLAGLVFAATGAAPDSSQGLLLELHLRGSLAGGARLRAVVKLHHQCPRLAMMPAHHRQLLRLLAAYQNLSSTLVVTPSLTLSFWPLAFLVLFSQSQGSLWIYG